MHPLVPSSSNSTFWTSLIVALVLAVVGYRGSEIIAIEERFPAFSDAVRELCTAGDLSVLDVDEMPNSSFPGRVSQHAFSIVLHASQSPGSAVETLIKQARRSSSVGISSSPQMMVSLPSTQQTLETQPSPVILHPSPFEQTYSSLFVPLICHALRVPHSRIRALSDMYPDFTAAAVAIRTQGLIDRTILISQGPGEDYYIDAQNQERIIEAAVGIDFFGPVARLQEQAILHQQRNPYVAPLQRPIPIRFSRIFVPLICLALGVPHSGIPSLSMMYPDFIGASDAIRMRGLADPSILINRGPFQDFYIDAQVQEQIIDAAVAVDLFGPVARLQEQVWRDQLGERVQRPGRRGPAPPDERKRRRDDNPSDPP